MISERLRKVRLAQDNDGKKMTQAAFGLVMGVSRDAIASYELGKVTPDDTFIKLLCFKFNVNEEWLRDGVGEMFVAEEDAILRQLADKHRLTGLDQAIIEQYLHLNDQHREVIRNMARSLAEYIATHPEDKPADAARHTVEKMRSEVAPELLPHIPGISPENIRKGYEYMQELQLEEDTPTSSALAAGGENAKKTNPD